MIILSANILFIKCLNSIKYDINNKDIIKMLRSSLIVLLAVVSMSQCVHKVKLERSYKSVAERKQHFDLVTRMK